MASLVILWLIAHPVMVQKVEPDSLDEVSEVAQEPLTPKGVDALLAQYQKESFAEPTRPVLMSGWMMTLASGRKVSRSFLQAQADPIIKCGRAAVPVLCRWVMSDDLHVRYIAVYSLQKITRLHPFVGYFDKEDKDHYREKAIAEWMRWAENCR